MPSKIQAIIFKKENWTKKSSSRKVKDLGFTPIKPVHETINYYRYRIEDPSKFDHFRIKSNSHGYSLVIGFN